MPYQASPVVSAARLSRARWGTFALFFTNGFVFANLIPRYPEIKDQLGLGDAGFGITVAFFPAGAILFGLLAAALIKRFGPATVAVVSTIVIALGFWSATLTTLPAVFAVCLLIAGGADAIADVSQNDHGLAVQNMMGQSIINTLHAAFSAGSVVGGGTAALAMWLGLAPQIQLALSGATVILIALAAHTVSLRPHEVEAFERHQDNTAEKKEPEPRPDQPAKFSRVERFVLRKPTMWLYILALVLMAITSSVVEDVGNSWAALYLRDSLGAPATLAAAGFTALVLGQLAGRLSADAIINRYSKRSVVATGGLIISLGMGSALLFPTIPGTIAGFFLAGLGVAPILPIVYDQAARIRGFRSGTGLTVVSWLMRVGYLLTPPLIGMISESTELRWALMIVPVAGLITFGLAWVLPAAETVTTRVSTSSSAHVPADRDTKSIPLPTSDGERDEGKYKSEEG